MTEFGIVSEVSGAEMKVCDPIVVTELPSINSVSGA